MTQISGDTNFYAPPLRGAQVFGGIAGIISNGDQPPHKSQKKDLDILTLASRSRELGAKQDMYRGTLAASWHLQAGELDAEECIEDIFSGGDGWVLNGAHLRSGTHLSPNSDSASDSFKLASGASSIASSSRSRVGWWSPQRLSSVSGDSIQLPLASNLTDRASVTSSKVNTGEGSSDSESQSVRTGGSEGSVAGKKRVIRGNTRDVDARSLASSERRKPFVSWGIETSLESLAIFGTPGSAGLTSKTGRKLLDGSLVKTPSQAERELHSRGEVDEVTVREDLKSWGKVR